MKLIKAYLSLASAEVFSKLLTFAAFAYLARVLGPDSYGYIEFAGAALMCATLVVDQGFSSFGAREIAKAPGETRRWVAEIITLRFLLAALSYLALAVFALTIDRGPVVLRLLLIYGLSLWALPLLLQWVFQGHDRMHLVAVAQIVRQIVFAILVFAFVRRSDQILIVAWAEVFAVAAAAVFCIAAYRKYFDSVHLTTLSISPRLFREGLPIGLSQMFWVVRMCGGTLILGLIATPSEVAYFGGAQRVLLALHTFVWLYFFNLLPSMARAWQANPLEFNHLIRKSMRSVVWVGLLITIVWCALANQAMTFIYGSIFKEGGPVLALFALVWLAALIDGHYRFGLVAAGRQNVEMLSAALGAVAALILVPLGYKKFGLNGAAAALFVAEIVIWFTSWWYARDLMSARGAAAMVCASADADAVDAALNQTS